ncbi:MAG: 30S ribosomal protein S4 [Candidatus Micrarchaeia archaeon]
MGDPRRLKKKYEAPKKLWDAQRIQEEQKLLEEYGLRSMRELWVVKQELKRIRREARALLSLGEQGRVKSKELLDKVRRYGFAKEDTSLEGLLSLGIRDILERRLETRVFKKGLARSMKQARQLIVHGLISVGGRRVSAPSYLVPAGEEESISYYKPINLGLQAASQERKEARSPGTQEAKAG